MLENQLYGDQWSLHLFVRNGPLSSDKFRMFILVSMNEHVCSMSPMVYGGRTFFIPKKDSVFSRMLR